MKQLDLDDNLALMALNSNFIEVFIVCIARVNTSAVQHNKQLIQILSENTSQLKKMHITGVINNFAWSTYIKFVNLTSITIENAEISIPDIYQIARDLSKLHTLKIRDCQYKSTNWWNLVFDKNFPIDTIHFDIPSLICLELIFDINLETLISNCSSLQKIRLTNIHEGDSRFLHHALLPSEYIRSKINVFVKRLFDRSIQKPRITYAITAGIRNHLNVTIDTLTYPTQINSKITPRTIVSLPFSELTTLIITPVQDRCFETLQKCTNLQTLECHNFKLDSTNHHCINLRNLLKLKRISFNVCHCDFNILSQIFLHSSSVKHLKFNQCIFSIDGVCEPLLPPDYTQYFKSIQQISIDGNSDGLSNCLVHFQGCLANIEIISLRKMNVANLESLLAYCCKFMPSIKYLTIIASSLKFIGIPICEYILNMKKLKHIRFNNCSNYDNSFYNILKSTIDVVEIEDCSMSRVAR